MGTLKAKVAALAACLAAAGAGAAELWIGAAEADITPDRPVSLCGQFRNRISTEIESRCTASVLALESREKGAPSDCAILISCDVAFVPANLQQEFRAFVAPRLPGFDTNKLFLAATHTHTGPTLVQGFYNDYGDAIQPKEYLPFLFGRLAEAAAKAWESRAPGAVAWGLGQAVVGANRRMTYADGTAAMYGNTAISSFRGLEGWEDHTVDVLCFLDARKELIAVSLTVPCPSQTIESAYQVSADYWHDVREALRKKHGAGLVMLGFCGPAGDQAPRPQLRKQAESRMERLRKLSRKQELGRRIAAAFEDTWEVIRSDIRTDVPFSHCVERFDVPGRKLTEQEYDEARKGFADYSAKPETEPDVYARKWWYKKTLDRYEAQQKADPFCAVELHVLRLGDVAIATNPFELFTDYTMRIQGRSLAEQTVLIQLASPVGADSYLPSERAVQGGGYSAVPQSSPVGPEGGQILVEKTLGAIRQLFAQSFEAGVSAYTFRQGTAFEAIEKAGKCGAEVVELFLWQKLSPQHPDVTVGPELTDAQFAALWTKLEQSGVRAVTAYFNDLGKTEAETRKLFAFAKRLGLRSLTGEPPADRLDLIEKLVKEYGVGLCFHNHAKNAAAPEYRNWDPSYLMALMEGRDPRMGFSVDTGHITRSGMDPVAFLKTVKGRVLAVHLKDVKEPKSGSPDVPYGQGSCDIPAVLDELKRQSFKGHVGVEFDHLSDTLEADVRQCLEVLKKNR